MSSRTENHRSRKHLRWSGALFVCALMLMALPSAWASPSGTYSGASAGLAFGFDYVALNASAPPGLLAGVANSNAASTPLANSRGAGTCETVGVDQPIAELPCTDSNEVSATVTSGESDPPKKCSSDETTSSSSFSTALSIATACGDALARVTNNDPMTTALGEVGRIEIGLGLPAIESQKDALIDSLAPIIPDGPVEAALLAALKADAKLVALPAGSTTSTVVSAGTVLRSRSDASGGTIGILGVPTCSTSGVPPATTCTPTPDPLTHGLIIISFSSAFAETSWDSATPVAKAAAQPSVVTVKVRDLTKPEEVAYLAERSITAGSPGVPLEGLPAGFATTISIQGAKTEQGVTDGKGSATASVDGVRIHALKGLSESSPGAGDGGLRIRVASAEARVLGQVLTSGPPMAATGWGSVLPLIALLAVLLGMRLRASIGSLPQR